MNNNEELTGIETWHLISPILAARLDGQEFSVMDKAYVKVYCALKYWDEHHKEKKGK